MTLAILTPAGFWPHGDPRDVARAIVTDPRYRLHLRRPAASGSWLDLAWSWLVAAIRHLLQGLDHALGLNHPLETAIGWAIIALTIGLFTYGVYRLVQSYARGARPWPSAAMAMSGAPSGPSSVALHTAAREAAQARRYRDAAALLFAATARALDERGRIAYDPARTPGEYRRLMHDPLFDVLAGDAVTALFAPAEPRHELFDRMDQSYGRFFDLPAQ